MGKNLTPEEEQELANKVYELEKESHALYEKRSNGITLEKNGYVGDRMSEIQAELGKLKSPKNNQMKQEQIDEPLPKGDEFQKAMEWWKTLSIDTRQTIRWILGDEIGCMSDDKYLEAYKKAKRQNF